jgi:cold shock CspA family protein
MEVKNQTPLERHVGRITKWIVEKGYGFVQSDMNGEGAFVHISWVTPQCDALPVGTIIEFTPARSGKGLGQQAVDAVVVG